MAVAVARIPLVVGRPTPPLFGQSTTEVAGHSAGWPSVQPDGRPLLFAACFLSASASAAAAAMMTPWQMPEVAVVAATYDDSTADSHQPADAASRAVSGCLLQAQIQLDATTDSSHLVDRLR